MPSFKITLDNGDSYVTSMAAGVTFAQASDYFLGNSFTQKDESSAKVIHIEEVH